MTPWTNGELNKIGTAEELKIASNRRNGALHKPVIIWVVRLGDDLYVHLFDLGMVIQKSLAKGFLHVDEFFLFGRACEEWLYPIFPIQAVKRLVES